MDEDKPPAPQPIAPPPPDASGRSIFLDDPEHPRMERIFSDIDTWGGLWDPANDGLVQLTLEPRKTKASAALVQWAAFQERSSVEAIAPVADAYLHRYSESWFNRSVENPIEYFDLVKNNFKEQRDARTSFNGLLADGARAALGGAPQSSERPPDDLPSTVSPAVLPTIASERLVQEWRTANPAPAARIPERRALSDMQILLDQISKTTAQQKTDVEELTALMADRSGKRMTSQLPSVNPEAEARLIDRFADMPARDRQYLYELSSLFGQTYGSKPDGIIDESMRRSEQTASVAGRAVAGPIRQVDRTVEHMSRLRRLTEMRNGAELYVSPTNPDDPILYSDLALSTPEPGFSTITLPPTIPKDWVPVTDEQRTRAIAQSERDLRRLQVRRELDNVIANAFDPIEPVSIGKLSERPDWIGFISRTRDKGEQALYDAVASVPSIVLAGSGIGIPALVTAQASQTFDETMASDPDADPYLAIGVASGVAVVNVALDRIKFDALLERYPWLKLRRWPKSPPATSRSRALDITWRGTKVLGKEYIAENAQNIVSILGRQLLEELDPKAKDIPIGDALDNLFASQERILFALLPFVAFASGRIGLNDMRNYDELLRNPKNLSYLGLSEEQVARITSESDPEKASEILQKEYAKTTQQERQEGVTRLAKDTQKEQTKPGTESTVYDPKPPIKKEKNVDTDNNRTQAENEAGLNTSAQKPITTGLETTQEGKIPSAESLKNVDSISAKIDKLTAAQREQIEEGADFPESLAQKIDLLYEDENEIGATSPTSDPLTGGLSMVPPAPNRGTNDSSTGTVLDAGNELSNGSHSFGRESAVARSGLSDHWSRTSAAFRRRDKETHQGIRNAIGELQRLNPGSNHRSLSRKLFDYLAGKSKNLNSATLAESLTVLKSRIRSLQSIEALERFQLLDVESVEAMVYLDVENKIVYKAVQISDGRAGNGLLPGRVLSDSGGLRIDYSGKQRHTFIEFLQRIERNNSHGGFTPLELIAVTRDGFAIFKQPFVIGQRIDPQRRSDALGRVGLRMIPDLEMHSAVAIVNGRSILFSDLHSDNILETPDGGIEIIDALSRELTDKEIAIIKESISNK